MKRKPHIKFTGSVWCCDDGRIGAFGNSPAEAFGSYLVRRSKVDGGVA